MSKKNPELGKQVEAHLEKVGLQTPWKDNGLTDEQKIAAIEALMTDVMNVIGLDLEDDSMVETPKRIAKLWVNDYFSGLKSENFPKCTAVENKMSAEDEFVCVKNINVTSVCEHHWLPFVGTNPGYAGATVAYIPKDKVIGISKLPRIIQYLCKRPQIQERLTNQIMEVLKFVLETDDVAVYVDAVHTCMTTRGIADPGASTVTVAMDGKFKDDGAIRKEFLDICKN